MPEIPKKKLFKVFVLYKFETLVPCDWMQQSQHRSQMLETLSKIFNGNAVKGHHRIAGDP
jgi:hypothetical protein